MKLLVALTGLILVCYAMWPVPFERYLVGILGVTLVWYAGLGLFDRRTQ